MGEVLAFQPAARRRAQDEIGPSSFGIRRIARSMFLTLAITALVSMAAGMLQLALFGG